MVLANPQKRHCQKNNPPLGWQDALQSTKWQGLGYETAEPKWLLFLDQSVSGFHCLRSFSFS
jgi:hypothetical protein